MKSLTILFLLFCFHSNSQYINIPDPNFKTYLLNNQQINTNGDYYISFEEAESFTDSIEIERKVITSLIGIEHFVNLRYLKICQIRIEELDLSHNIALKYLDCSFNIIHSLDLSNNTELTHLDCNRNRIRGFDISKNDQLTYLDCSSNRIDSIDIRHMLDLEYLDCSMNSISNNIDLSWNTKLTYFDCHYNNRIKIVFVSDIDVAKYHFKKREYTQWFEKSNDVSKEEFEKALADSTVKWNRKIRRSIIRSEIPQMLTSNEFRGGIYAGVTNHYELSCYSLGGEGKLYLAYIIPLLSCSMYANYKHLYVSENKSIPSNAISLGGHLGLVGLEGTCYFNRDQKLYYLTPKIGYDTGNFSLFYGYSFTVNKAEYSGGIYGHNISFKYLINFAPVFDIISKMKRYKI
jgi:hypothetical protein